MNAPKLMRGKKAAGQTSGRLLPVGTDDVESAAQLLSDREERLRALKLMFGAWKGRTDIPSDGMVFQDELRSE